VRDLGLQVGRVHRVVQAVRDAEVGKLAGGQRLVGAVGVVGNQHLVAGLQEGERHQRDGRQAAGHQQAFGAAFERGQALLERERGRRAVQAVGVAGLGLPVARAHGGHVGKEDGRCLEHAGLRRGEGGGRGVGMVDQGRRRLAHDSRPRDASASMPITNPQLQNHPFLQDMYRDAYFPDFLVDKCKQILVELCEAIEAKKPSDDAGLLKLTHAATNRFNDPLVRTSRPSSGPTGSSMWTSRM
jgi:hypothetical protein